MCVCVWKRKWMCARGFGVEGYVSSFWVEKSSGFNSVSYYIDGWTQKGGNFSAEPG